jgi:hypothetical protein
MIALTIIPLMCIQCYYCCQIEGLWWVIFLLHWLLLQLKRLNYNSGAWSKWATGEWEKGLDDSNSQSISLTHCWSLNDPTICSIPLLRTGVTIKLRRLNLQNIWHVCHASWLIFWSRWWRWRSYVCHASDSSPLVTIWVKLIGPHIHMNYARFYCRWTHTYRGDK